MARRLTYILDCISIYRFTFDLKKRLFFGHRSPTYTQGSCSASLANVVRCTLRWRIHSWFVISSSPAMPILSTSLWMMSRISLMSLLSITRDSINRWFEIALGVDAKGKPLDGYSVVPSLISVRVELRLGGAFEICPHILLSHPRQLLAESVPLRIGHKVGYLERYSHLQLADVIRGKFAHLLIDFCVKMLVLFARSCE